METLIAHPVNEEQSEALKMVMKALKVEFEVEDLSLPPQVVAGVKASLKEADERKVIPIHRHQSYDERLMALTIFYTKAARDTFLATYNFISEKFGAPQAEKFLDKANSTINLIADFPLMFRRSEFDENVRKGLISKQTSIFYRVTDTEIQLLFFWDNRQEPFYYQ